jgi:hypothetical protein
MVRFALLVARAVAVHALGCDLFSLLIGGPVL